MIIYLITNTLTGKKYVGQTTRTLKKRFKEHIKNFYGQIDKAISEYGAENFKIEILEECKSISELNEREKFWIEKLNCRFPNGYNVMPGGCNFERKKNTSSKKFSTTKFKFQYGISTARGVHMFISKHLAEINSDGEHAKQTIEGWMFDAEAVKRIDELRGLSSVAVVEQMESERVKELQEENENLRQLLLMAQSKLIKVQADLTENQKLLSESDKKLLAAENLSKENDMNVVRLQADLKIEKSKREIAEDKILEIKSQLDESQRQLEKIKNRGLIDRIFNNF